MSSVARALREGDAIPVISDIPGSSNSVNIPGSLQKQPNLDPSGDRIPHVRIRPNAGRGHIDFHEIVRYRDLL